MSGFTRGRNGNRFDSGQKKDFLRSLLNGAVGRSRTGTWLPTQDFESSTSTNFITTACLYSIFNSFVMKLVVFNWSFLRFATVSSSQRLKFTCYIEILPEQYKNSSIIFNFIKNSVKFM